MGSAIDSHFQSWMFESGTGLVCGGEASGCSPCGGMGFL